MSPLAKLLSTLGRFYPFYSGCLRLANSKFFRWALGKSSGVVWIRLRGGTAWILVPIDDWLGRTLYYFGALDPKITWVCKKILRPGDTVLDIGANVGTISIISRKIVGTTGQVHAFEPQSFLVELMRKSLEKNGYSNVVVHNIALGEQKESKDFLIPKGHAGAASFTRTLTPSKNISVLVENATAYLTHLDLPSLRLVRIDVNEGYETEIIKGASEFFETNLPDSILFRLYSGHNRPLFFQQPVVNKLSELGYQFFNFPLPKKSVLKMRLYRIDSSIPLNKYGHEILAVQKGEISNEIARRVGVV
jgi:FkbM family methyltransferase